MAAYNDSLQSADKPLSEPPSIEGMTDDEVLQTVSEYLIKEFKTYYEGYRFALLDFQGFQPAKLFKVVLERCKGNMDLALRLILNACALFVSRGNNIVKMKQRSTPEVMKLIDDLERYLGITNGTGGPDVITIPRIAGTFPLIPCKLLFAGMVSPALRPDKNYPLVMCNTVFPSVIPANSVNLAKASFYFVIRFDELINAASKKKRKSGKENIQQNLRYFEIQWRSTTVDNIDRVNACTVWGLLGKSGALNPGLVDYAKKTDQILLDEGTAWPFGSADEEAARATSSELEA